MKLQFISDLHLELSDNSAWIMDNIPEISGDILLIAGDSGYLDKNGCYQMHPFWKWASEHYQQVIVAMGNHEFYRDFDIATLEDGYCTEIRQNVKAYYNAVVHVEDTDIIVSTLWAHIRPEDAFYTERGVSDFYRSNIEATIGTTKILSNQLGYIAHGEYLRNGYKNNKYIEL